MKRNVRRRCPARGHTPRGAFNSGTAFGSPAEDGMNKCTATSPRPQHERHADDGLNMYRAVRISHYNLQPERDLINKITFQQNTEMRILPSIAST